MSIGDYIPEYILARISAAVMFSIMNTEPKIDSLSEIGDFGVNSLPLIIKSIYAGPKFSQFPEVLQHRILVFCIQMADNSP